MDLIQTFFYMKPIFYTYEKNEKQFIDRVANRSAFRMIENLQVNKRFAGSYKRRPENILQCHLKVVVSLNW